MKKEKVKNHGHGLLRQGSMGSEDDAVGRQGCLSRGEEVDWRGGGSTDGLRRDDRQAELQDDEEATAVPVGPTMEALATFRKNMEALGLWSQGTYGHWLYLYVSV
jgi:hypothetical protein